MKHSRSSLFLMELIIAILFFSLSSTVCIQLFARSHMLSQQTVNQNHAVIEAQNLAEIFLSTGGDISQMKELFPQNPEDTSDNTFIIWLNENWEECDASESKYIAGLTASPEKDGFITADIIVCEPDSDSEPLYKLRLKHHVAERRGTLEH